MSGTLGLFWKLASDESTERIAASLQLVQELETVVGRKLATVGTEARTAAKEQRRITESSRFQDTGNPAAIFRARPDEVQRIETFLQQDAPEEVSYAFKRLLRGLASPRQSSRLGFVVALTQLLSESKLLTADEVITLALHYCKTEGKATGQEERDSFFAKLFAIHSLVVSGLLIESNASVWKRAMEIIITLRNRKSWLRESCTWVLIKALDQIRSPSAPVTWAADALTWAQQRLFSPPSERKPRITSDKLAILLALQYSSGGKRRTDLNWEQSDISPLKHSDALHASNLQHISKILRGDVPAAEEGAEGVTATETDSEGWRPDLPIAWLLVFDIYLSDKADQQSPVSGRISFGDLFDAAVDKSLFAQAASSERKLWGFKIFDETLLRIARSSVTSDERKCELVAQLFGSNLMRSLINHLSKKDRYLHAAATNTAKTMVDATRLAPAIGVTIAQQLLADSKGNLQFDKITHTKTVDHILSQADAPSLARFVSSLFDLANKPLTADGSDEPKIDNRRRYVIEQLQQLLKVPHVFQSDSTVYAILVFLAARGFATQQKAIPKPKGTAYDAGAGLNPLAVLPEPAFSADMQATCRTRFVSFVADLYDRTRTVTSAATGASVDARAARAQGVDSTGRRWIVRALELIRAMSADKARFAPTEVLQEASLQVKFTSDGEKQIALDDLLAAAMLHEMVAAEAQQESLVETLSACKDVLLSGSPQADGEPSKGLVLVDALVSCFEQPSAFLRSVALQAFGKFPDLIDKSAIMHILEVSIDLDTTEVGWLTLKLLIGPRRWRRTRRGGGRERRRGGQR